MSERDFKKWKPFNSVCSPSTLLDRKQSIKKPNLSEDEINLVEEFISSSYYQGTEVTITYLENNSIKEVKSIVTKVNPVNKNIYLDNGTIINFRQIYKVN